MQQRLLPVDEWYRLEGTEVGPVWRALNPENTRIVVVEDEGEIVATWAMLRVVHAECLWVAPKYRGLAGVARRLFKGLREVAAAWGVERVVTGSQSPVVTGLIERFGGFPMPCESFVLPVTMSPHRRSDRDLGRSFHDQLRGLVAEEQHPEDPAHDEMVGRTIRVAVDEGDPARAEGAYNRWAFGAGYAPIRFLGYAEDRLRADIVTARIEVGRDHVVRVTEEQPCRQQQPQR